MATHFHGEDSAGQHDIPHTSQMLDDNDLLEVQSDVYESPTSKRLREEQEADPTAQPDQLRLNGSEMTTKGFVMPQPMSRTVAPMKSKRVQFQPSFSMMFAPLATPRTPKEEPSRKQAGLTKADNAAAPARQQATGLNQHASHQEAGEVDTVTKQSPPGKHGVSTFTDETEPDHNDQPGYNQSTAPEAAAVNHQAHDAQDDVAMVEAEQIDQPAKLEDHIIDQQASPAVIEVAEEAVLAAGHGEPVQEDDELPAHAATDDFGRPDEQSYQNVPQEAGEVLDVLPNDEQNHAVEVDDGQQHHVADIEHVEVGNDAIADELDDTCVDSGVDNSCIKQNEATRHSSVKSSRVTKSRQRAAHREHSQGLQIPAELSPEELAHIWEQRYAKARATVKNIQQHLGEVHNENKGLQEALENATRENHDLLGTNEILETEAASFQDKYRKLKAFAKKLSTEMNVFRTDRQKHLATQHEMEIAKQHYQAASADLQATAKKVQEDFDKQRHGGRTNIAALKSDLSSHGKALKSLQDLEKERHQDLRKEQIANDQLRKDVAAVRQSQLSAEQAAQKHAELFSERASEISASITKLPETLHVQQTEHAIKDCHQAVKAQDSKNLASQKDVGNLATSVTRLQESVTSQEVLLREGFKEASAQCSKIEAATASAQAPVQQLLDRTQTLAPDLAKMQDLQTKNVELKAKAEAKTPCLCKLKAS
ncbi:uncharacterized protein AB675_11252 [Cyphellophora attinorum]|uniref:Uncharacterized protein n=1 Tax=Cyphellophora attinorum TaxID=1664694 RepID=A0A0N1H3Z8_9EURO|nr:uncharacterized protein AB675_11252 [Phialophora attinorum]KPI39906.1 hypothetical protein AB675_11252 [Phialophora attinorum]